MNAQSKPGVLEVLDYHVQTFKRLNAASPADHVLDIEDAEQVRATVERLASESREALSCLKTYAPQCVATIGNLENALADFRGDA